MSQPPVDNSDNKLAGYEIIEEIGKGGMGRVYKARGQDGQLVAIKILDPRIADNKTQLARFYQEAELAMRINHPNVARGFKVGEHERHHYFVMEYVEGETLGKLIKRRGPLQEKRAVNYASQMAMGLHRLHKEGMIHRDIKPENVIISNEGVLKLIDLGLAKDVDTDLNLTRPGHGLGTPQFMAPEQFKNAKDADVRCDVYGLGATLYVMLTGQLPFRGQGALETFRKKTVNEYTPAEEINPAISESLSAALRATMHGNPRKRPGSAKAFAKLISGEISTDLASRAVSPLERRGVQSAEQALWYVQIEQPDGRIEKFSARSDVLLGLLAKKNIPSHALVSKHRDGPFDLIANVNINEAPLDAPKSPNASGDEEYTDDGFKDLDAEFNNLDSALQDTDPDQDDLATSPDTGKLNRLPVGRKHESHPKLTAPSKNKELADQPGLWSKPWVWIVIVVGALIIVAGLASWFLQK